MKDIYDSLPDRLLWLWLGLLVKHVLVLQLSRWLT